MFSPNSFSSSFKRINNTKLSDSLRIIQLTLSAATESTHVCSLLRRRELACMPKVYVTSLNTTIRLGLGDLYSSSLDDE